MAHYLALTCEALARSIYAAAAQTDHTITVQLYRQGLHNRPKGLRAVLQEQIDAAADKPVDAILLAYGMCGTSTIGLTARQTPLVMPRAHDCITLYLGSRERYQAEFDRHPGTYWYSVDYMERAEPGASVALGAAGIETSEAEYEKYVQKYGQETADMLMEEIRGWAKHYTRAGLLTPTWASRTSFWRRPRTRPTKKAGLLSACKATPACSTCSSTVTGPTKNFWSCPRATPSANNMTTVWSRRCWRKADCEQPTHGIYG